MFSTSAWVSLLIQDNHLPLMTVIKLFFVEQVSGDMLEDGKYQCNLKDDLAQKLANNLQINLNAYLLYV